MKLNLLSIALLSLIIGLTSCGDDNYDIMTEEENHTPVTVDIEDGVTYGLSQSSFTTNTSGYGHKSNTTYVIASQDAEVQCNPDGSISGSFDGIGDFFFFLFNANETNNVVSIAGFETEVDGVTVLADNVIVPPDCLDGRIEVEFEESEDRIFGTFTGEFFTFADDLVSPFDSCVNYRSLGILEASFNVELILCD